MVGSMCRHGVACTPLGAVVPARTMCCPSFPHVLPHRPQIVIGLLVLVFGQDLPDGERPASLI